MPPQNRFILEGALEIHNGGQNARFGSALAPVPDLNGDGFNDLVVGAPLEDDHKGAIYVFFSQHNRILRKYKQVGSVRLEEDMMYLCSGIQAVWAQLLLMTKVIWLKEGAESLYDTQ